MLDEIDRFLSSDSPGLWSGASAVTSSDSVLTLEKLHAAIDAIWEESKRPPQPEYLLLPPPVYGTNQAARRRRTVHDLDGTRYVLPNGSNPMLWMIMRASGRSVSECHRAAATKTRLWNF